MKVNLPHRSVILNTNIEINDVLHWCIFSLVLILALFLRINHLGDAIWYDELITHYTISLSYSEILSYLGDYSVHPPLYYLLLKTWSLIWGNDFAVLRVFSTIMGVLSIAYLMRSTSKLFDRVTSYFVGIIISVSAFHIYYSQEMRSYSLFFLMIVFSFSQFVYFLRNPGNRKAQLLYLLSIIMLGYTHIYGLIIILTQFLHACFISYSHRSNLPIKRLVFLQILFVIAFLPWIPMFLEQISHKLYWDWIPETSPEIWKRVFFDFSNRSMPVFLFSGVLLVAACIWGAVKKNFLRTPTDIASLLLWLLFPLAVSFILSWTYGSVLVSRYAQQVFFAYILILAVGFGIAYKSYFSHWVKMLTLGIFFSFILLQVLDQSRNGVVIFRDRGSGWEEVAMIFLENRSQDDLLIAYAEMSSTPDFPVLRNLIQYYDQTKHLNYHFISQTAEIIDLQVDEYSGAWLIIFSFSDIDYVIDHVHGIYLPGYELQEKFKNQSHALFKLVKQDVP